MTVRPGDEFDFWVTIYVESRINGFAFGVAIDATQFEILEGQHSDGVLALGPFHPNLSHAVGLGDELNDDPNDDPWNDPWNDPRRFGVVATALFPVLPAPGVSFPVEDNFPIISVRLRVLPRATGRALLEFSNELVPKLGAPHTIVNYSIQRVSTPPPGATTCGFDTTGIFGIDLGCFRYPDRDFLPDAACPQSRWLPADESLPWSKDHHEIGA